jgi:hemolysin activation/secretion protein
MWKQLAWLCVLWPTAVAAQAPGAPVGSNDPIRALPPPPASAGVLDTTPLAAPPAQGADFDQRFVLTGVRFEGAATLTDADLRPAWAGQAGTQVSLADLRRIAARAEAIFAERGYPFVAVVLAAPQRVENGLVRFTVVEGRISDLTIISKDPAARRQAAASLGPLVDKQPLTTGDIEAAYEAAKAVPGLTVAGALRRGGKPGGIDLVVQARRESWRVYANVNNLYADPVGPWGVLVGVDYFGGSRFGDQTSVQLYSTTDWGEQQVFRASHMRRLTASGLAVSLTGLVAKAEPRGVVGPLDLATDVVSGRLEVSQPLWRRSSGYLVASLALDATDQETRIFSNIGLTEDRLRVASGMVSGELRSGQNRLAYAVELRKGLDFAGASQRGDANLSRLGADPQATVGRLRVEGEAAFTPKLRLNLRFEGQRADTSLAAPEEYSVGNLTIGRGYEPGSGFGDSAAGVAAEVRFGPFPVGGKIQAQPFLFYDAVKLWNEDPLSVNGRTLESAGGGVRFELPGRIRLDLLYAEPRKSPLGLGDSVPQPRLLLNLTTSLDNLFDGLFGGRTSR